MALLIWQEQFSVGVPEIDAQHRGLMDLINRTAEEPLAGSGMRQFIRTIDALVLYAEIHFAAEERLMQDAGYAGLSDHQREHVAFSADVRRLENLLEFGSGDLQQPLVSFLRNWYLTHVLETDQKYVPVLRQARQRRPSPGASN